VYLQKLYFFQKMQITVMSNLEHSAKAMQQFTVLLIRFRLLKLPWTKRLSDVSSVLQKCQRRRLHRKVHPR